MGRRAAFAHDHSEAAAWMPSLLFFFENALSELTLAANTTSAACGAGPSKKSGSLSLLGRIQVDQVDQLEIIGQKRDRIFIALCFVGMS